MLEVQKLYTPELLSSLAISKKDHPTLPISILNYCQLDSPKTNPVVRECRGLVLEFPSLKLVAKSFNRFFNLGEGETEFDWNFFDCYEKVDGSFVLLYNYNGEWIFNTRATFGDCLMNNFNRTWGDTIRETFESQYKYSILNPDYAYTFEFVGPWNQVVKYYNRNRLYLLTVFEGERELTPSEQDSIPMEQAQYYNLKSLEEIQNYINEKSAEDSTWEGVVIRDRENRRYKVKSPAYLSLHKLKSGVGGLEELVTIVLTGETAEIVTYFPHIAKQLELIKKVLDDEYIALYHWWLGSKDIENQKDFALSVKDCKWSSMMFNAKKYKTDVSEFWFKGSKLITNTLKGRLNAELTTIVD